VRGIAIKHGRSGQGGFEGISLGDGRERDFG